MKNIETILSDFGITIPEGKAADLRKAVAENYKTVAEFTKLQERHDALDTSLKDVQGKLAAFDGVDVAALKGQITTLTNDLQTERDNRKKTMRAASRSTTCLPALSPIRTARRSPASLWPIPPARRAFRPITAAWCRRRGAQKNT